PSRRSAPHLQPGLRRPASGQPGPRAPGPQPARRATPAPADGAARLRPRPPGRAQSPTHPDEPAHATRTRPRAALPGPAQRTRAARSVPPGRTRLGHAIAGIDGLEPPGRGVRPDGPPAGEAPARGRGRPAGGTAAPGRPRRGPPPERRGGGARAITSQVLEEHARSEILVGRAPLNAQEEEDLAEAIHAALFGVGRLQ